MTRRNRQKEENVQDVNKFMREVEEAMHVDNMLAFWNDYKVHIISSVIGLFVVVTSWQWYVNARETGYENQANALWTVKQSGTVAPESYNDIIENGTNGYQLFAWFNKAEAFTKQNELQKAIVVYKDIIENVKAKEFADLAKLKMSLLLLDKDILKAQEVASELVKAESPFMYSAKEVLAMSYEKQGKLEDALKQYENIAVNPSIPQGMRTRVQARIDALNRRS